MRVLSNDRVAMEKMERRKVKREKFSNLKKVSMTQKPFVEIMTATIIVGIIQGAMVGLILCIIWLLILLED